MERKIRHSIKTVTDDDALNGRWYKYDDGFVRITILRDLMFITSLLAGEGGKNVNIELPGHPAFHVMVVSEDGVSAKLLDKNDPLKVSVPKGASINGVVGLSYT